MPSISLSPSPVNVGGTFTVTGAGFNFKQKIQCALDSVWGSAFRVSKNGSFQTTFTASATAKTQTVSVRYQGTSTVVATASIVVQAPVTPPWGGVPFMTRPASAPLSFSGLSTATEVTNLSFTGSIFPHSAIRFEYCSGDIWIHDCDFDLIDWDSIDIIGCTGNLKIEYNRSGRFYRSALQTGRMPDFIQLAEETVVGGTIRYNKVKTGGVNEDIISTVNNSGGRSSTDRLDISYNQIQGGNIALVNGIITSDPIPLINGNASGSGTMLADSTDGTHGHIDCHHNTYLNPQQVGAAISMGIDCHFNDNTIYGGKRVGSNVGFYTPYYAGPSTPFATNPGGHEAARNRIFWLDSNGNANPLSDGGASGTVAGLTTNILQDTTIDWTKLVVNFNS